jgi:KaiC/GvpD/RAD55 family RecA-like ATPase
LNLPVKALPPGFFAAPPSHPFLKLAVYGENGSGKTWLLAALAIELARRSGVVRVASLGSELATAEVAASFAAAGIELLHRESRDVADLLEVMRLGREGIVAIVMVDSLTHFWEAFVELSRAQLGVTTRPLSASERGDIKSEWRRRIAEPLVRDRAHYLVSARASAEYESETDRDTQRRESYASGLRMRSEGDTGYEANLVVRMERREVLEAGKIEVFRQAIVEKDRSAKIDGKVFRNPTAADFAPAIESLLARPATEGPAIGSKLSAPLLFHGPGSAKERESRAARKAILLEEIEAWLEEVWPGSGKDAARMKGVALGSVFRSESKTYRLSLPLEELELRHEELYQKVISLTSEPGKAGRAPRSAARDFRQKPAAQIDEAAFMAEMDAGLSGAPRPSKTGQGPDTPAPAQESSPLPGSAPGPMSSSATVARSNNAGSFRRPDLQSTSGGPPAEAAPPQVDSAKASPGAACASPSTSARPGLCEASREVTPGALSLERDALPPVEQVAVPGKSVDHDKLQSAAPAPQDEGRAPQAGSKKPEEDSGKAEASSSEAVGLPCFFCKAPISGGDRWVLLKNPVTSDLAELTGCELTAAEGLHRCYPNQLGARFVKVAGRLLGIKPDECFDACDACGLRESDGGGSNDEPDPPALSSQNDRRPESAPTGRASISGPSIDDVLDRIGREKGDEILAARVLALADDEKDEQLWKELGSRALALHDVAHVNDAYARAGGTLRPRGRGFSRPVLNGCQARRFFGVHLLPRFKVSPVRAPSPALAEALAALPDGSGLP